MHKIFFTFLFLTLCRMAMSQGVGIGTASPNANAALEIKQTTNKGLIIPRGNTATRTALSSNTAKGLMLYDTMTNSLWIHNGNGMASGWTNQQIISSSSIIPYASGNTISMTSDFITGNPSTVALVGFGNSISGITIGGGIIDIGFGSGSLNQAFSMPRDGTI